jgi:hypothetical protein
MYRYASTEEFGNRHKELTDNGLKLIDVEPFTDGGSLKWAGVWVAGDASLLNRNYSTTDFGDLRESRNDNGWKLIDMERYQVGGSTQWAGVWEASSQAEVINRNYMLCGVKDVNNNWVVPGILNRHEQWSDGGYELIDWERD